MKRAELAAAERVSTFLVAARQSALTVHRRSRALTPQAWTASPVTGNSEASLQFRNGAAWLGGRDDAARKAIRAHARDLYNAGSKYRHGGNLLSLYDSRDHDAPPTSGKVFDITQAVDWFGSFCCTGSP
ncbi:MAG: hypothetical protein ACRDRB_24265, partial [Pseudonocardiaceae bacterium]